jgi:hypothetical protein
VTARRCQAASPAFCHLRSGISRRNNVAANLTEMSNVAMRKQRVTAAARLKRAENRQANRPADLTEEGSCRREARKQDRGDGEEMC